MENIYWYWHQESYQYIDGLVQERRNSIAKAMELRLSFTNPSIWQIVKDILKKTVKGMKYSQPILFQIMISSLSLMARSHDNTAVEDFIEILKPQDYTLTFCIPKIWQAAQQQCCPGTCQISNLSRPRCIY